MVTKIQIATKTNKKYIKGGIYRRTIKRLMDFVLSLCAIIILLPVLLLVAILVRIELGSPVIFKQKRPGLNETIFTLYKFRSMTDEKNANDDLLPDEIRLTKIGRFLRSTSLDELPELLNILKGDMAIVGPRPLLVQYLPYYTDTEKQRHSVRPGLTGLAQVSGRNFLDWDERLAKDLEYISAISFIGDSRIIYITAKEVFKRKNIAVNSNMIEGNLADKRQKLREGIPL